VAKRYTRKALKKPDEFVSFWHRAYEAAAPYGRAIGWACLGGIAVIAVAWALQHWSEGKRQDATQRFAEATKIAEAELLGPDEKPEKPDTSEDATPRFKTEKERGEAALAKVDDLLKTRGATDAAHKARLFRAGLLFDLGRFEDAEAGYRDYLKEAPEGDPLKLMAKEGVGLCLEERGKLDEALAAFKELEPKSGDFYRDRALFDQGRVLAKKGDTKAAADAYRDVLTKSPQTPLKEAVEGRLGMLGAAPPPSSLPQLPGGIQLPAGLQLPAPGGG
jgi:hypothetical protein